MKIEPRLYQSSEDLRNIGRLVRTAEAKSPYWNAWSYARYDIWAQRRKADDPSIAQKSWQQELWIWPGRDDLPRGALFFWRGQAVLLIDPEYRDLAEEMLIHAEAHCQEKDASNRRPDVEATESNAFLNVLLQSRGYARSHDWMFCRARSLDSGIPDAVELPDGFSIRGLQGDEDLKNQMAAVKVVFNFEDNLEAYHSIQRAPSYVPEGDLTVWSPQGEVASFCSVWANWEAGRAEFEPVGTRPEYRKMGLGQALMAETCNRLRRRGLHVATVESWSQSVEANRLYESAGFRPIDRIFTWAEKKE